MTRVSMTRMVLAAGLAATAILASSPWTLRAVEPSVTQQTPTIASLTEAGEGLAVVQSSPTGGRAVFAAVRGAGQGILLPVAATDAAEERASVFVDHYGAQFGLAGRANVRVARAPQRDGLGIEHVKFQQLHMGVPVAGGEFVVHLTGARATGANGRVLEALPSDLSAGIQPAAAVEAARQVIAKYKAEAAGSAQYSAPRLEVVNRAFLEHRPGGPSRLAWFVEATGPGLRQFIWIDAQTGGLILQFSQLHRAKNRQVSDANGTNGQGSLVRSEGQPPSGIADVDSVYTLLGETYDYFFNLFGRDSYDGLGATLRATVRQVSAFSCPDASWNGFNFTYCNGFASADDLTGHEFSHAVTDFEANLFSLAQSGALNESFADIFGETIDLVQHVTAEDTPASRWLIAEDVPEFGPFRHMMDPTIFGDPGKMSDVALFKCDPSAEADNGGIHSNNGVPNHAYALMVDGGSYNGSSINGIGFEKAARIHYRALTTYLTSSSGFADAFSALSQSCQDLTGTAGITYADCDEVQKALLAVEMNRQPGCFDQMAMVQPAMCPAGGTPEVSFSEGFENFIPGWTNSHILYWQIRAEYASEGARSLLGFPPEGPSELYIDSPSIVVPQQGRLIFDHSFSFDKTGNTAFDGGVIAYSLDFGVTWIDAGSLIDGGYTYNGVMDPLHNNPLGGRQAFTGSTLGYGKTRVNLASLSGAVARFRWQMGTDVNAGGGPWFIDDVRVYRCSTVAGAPVIVNQPVHWVVAVGSSAGNGVTATGNPTLRYQWLRNGFPIAGATAANLSLQNVQFSDAGYYSVIVSNDLGTTTSDAVQLTIIPLNMPVFSLQPVSRTVTEGQTAQFSTEVVSQSSVTYAWQLSSNGGATWNGVPNAPPFTGVATKTLTVSGAPLALNGTRFRVVATNVAGSATSRVATLNVLSSSLVANGDFGSGELGWTYFDSSGSGGEHRVSGGVFEWNRPGNSATQSVIFQNTGAAVSGAALQAQFDLGNSAPVRQRVSVLIIDSDFSDLSVCTFWLEPSAPMRTYRMRAHPTRPWANAAIYFYAATTNSSTTNGGYARLDNVSLSDNPTGSTRRTECEDPTSPPHTPGAPASASLIANGDFAGGMASWTTLFTITSQVSNGVFEFIRTAGLPGGVLLQQTGAAVSANEFLTATLDLGNSSPVRKRVTVVVHAADFTDLAACTFWLPPGLPLSTYQMRMRATTAWTAGAGTGATLSVFGATVGLDQWIRLDNVSLQRTPGFPLVGTECLEPVEILSPASIVRRPAAGSTASFVGLTVEELTGTRPIQVDPAAGGALTFVSWMEGDTASGDVEVSLDGRTWRTIARVRQDRAWTEVEVDLSEYAGHRIYLRFVRTEASGETATWRIGNVRVSGGD